MASPWRRPIADHSRGPFIEADAFVRLRSAPVILDSCCGTGDSSRLLAVQFSGHTIIGFDKSLHRLSRERSDGTPDNLMLIRADMNDLYRLIVDAEWRLERHYLFYPNPWPKAAHLKRRIHGSPVFPTLCKLAGKLEVRSNWRVYLEELQCALQVAGHEASITKIEPVQFASPFERKYAASEHELYRLRCDLDQNRLW